MDTETDDLGPIDHDTITIDTKNLPKIDLSAFDSMNMAYYSTSMTAPAFTYSTLPSSATVTIGASGSSTTAYTYSAGANGSFGTIGSMGVGVTGSSKGLHVQADAEFEGDIKWKGRSLGKMLEKIEDRLAILTEPDPAKLEKFAALKKAYDQYKLMEKLIGDDWKDKDGS